MSGCLDLSINTLGVQDISVLIQYLWVLTGYVFLDSYWLSLTTVVFRLKQFRSCWPTKFCSDKVTASLMHLTCVMSHVQSYHSCFHILVSSGEIQYQFGYVAPNSIFMWSRLTKHHHIINHSVCPEWKLFDWVTPRRPVKQIFQGDRVNGCLGTGHEVILVFYYDCILPLMNIVLRIQFKVYRCKRHKRQLFIYCSITKRNGILKYYTLYITFKQTKAEISVA